MYVYVLLKKTSQMSIRCEAYLFQGVFSLLQEGSYLLGGLTAAGHSANYEAGAIG